MSSYEQAGWVYFTNKLGGFIRLIAGLCGERQQLRRSPHINENIGGLYEPTNCNLSRNRISLAMRPYGSHERNVVHGKI